MDKTPNTPPPAENESNPLAKALKVLAYPFSAAAGLWITHHDIHDSVYHNLKRYGAFDDILDTLKPMNETNVQDRIAARIEQAEFLEKSEYTRKAYTNAVTERMEHLGLGGGMENFANKWAYNSRGGKREAAIKGLTVAGVAIGATLTMANSKVLNSLLGQQEQQSESR